MTGLRLRVAAVACAGLLTAALALPWLRAALGPARSAWDLPLQLPGIGRPAGATWAAVGIALVVAHAAVAAVPARHLPAATRVAAALSGTAVGGFLLLGALADGALQQQLQDGQQALDAARRMLGYRLPRPSVTTLGPFDLPSGAASLLSAVRGGFLLLLLAAGLSVTLWALARRAAPAAGHPGAVGWVPRVLVGALAVLTVAVAVQAVRADRLHDRATEELAAGAPDAARADVTTAVALNPTLRARPAVQQLLSDVAVATASGTAAQQLYGRSLSAQDAGDVSDALDFAVRAAAAAPAEPAYAVAVCQLATARATGADGVDTVRALVPVTRRCDLALLRLAATELAAGRFDLVAIDARQLAGQTPDADLRSAAVTMLAQAALGSGDLTGGRALLQQAIAADPMDRNVVARSLATGLYSAAR